VLTLACITQVQLEHLQEFPKLTPNLDFFSKIEQNCSPTTLYLNSQSFRTGENQSNSVEIYVRVSIGQYGGGGRMDKVPNANIQERKKVYIKWFR